MQAPAECWLGDKEIGLLWAKEPASRVNLNANDIVGNSIIIMNCLAENVSTIVNELWSL